jgi:hypothetical protein
MEVLKTVAIRRHVRGPGNGGSENRGNSETCEGYLSAKNGSRKRGSVSDMPSESDDAGTHSHVRCEMHKDCKRSN